MASAGKDSLSQLASAKTAFDHLFSNQIDEARREFAKEQAESPYHNMGLGVCAFLEAALGMEVCIIDTNQWNP